MEITPPILSILICTRNRAYLLEHCLNSFVKQHSERSKFEVLIIDNGSTDNTIELVNRFTAQYSHFRYSTVSKIGLSHARNQGCHKALGEWVAFIDDDARVPANFVARILWVIKNYDFDCFGGTYTAWYPFGKPKWLPSEFGNKEKLLDETGEIQEGFLSGGIMICKKEVMENLDGFSTQIGMKQGVGYGEDDEIQIRMRQAGYKLGFDPNLIMEHAVLPHKFKLSWHFRAAYAKGRDRAIIHPEGRLPNGIYLLLRSILGLFLKRLPIAIFRWGSHPNYYWQNLAYDTFLPIAYYLGHIKGIKANKA